MKIHRISPNFEVESEKENKGGVDSFYNKTGKKLWVFSSLSLT